ncbi:MAG: ATP-binding protein [Proteobacteria bacterium]|nr:ATP-binding protein [Pseudomonadota bacterium]
MIKRELELKLRESVQRNPVVALTGARQSGKTTLLKYCFPERNYQNLENPETRAFAIEDPMGFLQQDERDITIDEIQRAPELLSYIQVMVDQKPSKGRFIVSGSNNFLLMKAVSQSLAGRVSILKLMPFSYFELQDSKYGSDDHWYYLNRGFYPRVYDQDPVSSEWYQDYIETYLEKDLKDFIRVNDLYAFRKLLVLLASNCGQLLNLSSLGNSLGISYNTIKAWIAALEASFIIFLLPSYHRNFKKRLVKTPKVYFYDTGIICSLLNIKGSQQVAGHFIGGHLFENMIVSEVFKNSHNQGLRPDFYFWRDHTGNEIDLLWEEGQDLSLLEIKSAQTISSHFFKGIQVFQKSTTATVKNAFIIYGGDEEQTRGRVRVISWNQLDRGLPARETVGH